MPPIRKIVKDLEKEALKYLDLPMDELKVHLKTLENDVQMLGMNKDPRLREYAFMFGAALLAFLTRTIPEAKKAEFRKKVNAERERKRTMKKHKRCTLTAADIDRIVYGIGKNPDDPRDPINHMKDWEEKYGFKLNRTVKKDGTRKDEDG